MNHKMIFISIVTILCPRFAEKSSQMISFSRFSTMTELLIIFHFTIFGCFCMAFFSFAVPKIFLTHFASNSKVQCIFNLFLAARLFFTTVFIMRWSKFHFHDAGGMAQFSRKSRATRENITSWHVAYFRECDLHSMICISQSKFWDGDRWCDILLKIRLFWLARVKEPSKFEGKQNWKI